MSRHVGGVIPHTVMIVTRQHVRKEPPADVVVIYFDPDDRERLVEALPRDLQIAAFGTKAEALDYLQFADKAPKLIVFDCYVSAFDGLLLCARLRELCPDARLLPLAGEADTVEALEQLGCLPAVDEDDANIAVAFKAALAAPPPPPPSVLVRALIKEARIAEAYIRGGGDNGSVLVYATTRERAQRLRKEFGHRGPVYVASDLDELQRLDSDHYASLFVAADDDAQLADPIMGRENLDRVTLHIHPDPTKVITLPDV